MKIVIFHDNSLSPGSAGATVSTYDLAIGMKEAGHDVSVITTCRKSNEAGESDFNGLRIFKIASDYPSKWRSYLSLYNPPVVRQVEGLLKKIRPDVVHIQNIHFYLSYHCFKLAKRYAKVVVFTARDVMSFNFGKLETERYLKNFDGHITWLDQLQQAKKRWNPFRNFFIKRYLRYADNIFAVSFALKKVLEQNSIKGISVIHSGADVTQWQVGEEERGRFREKYNVCNKKVILFGGRLSGSKGGKQVLEAMVRISKETRDTVFLIVASLDEQTNRLKAEALRLGIEDRLVFTGWINREEIKYIYACADLVLVPSICFDSFPRIVLEAMAAGKPVVGTHYGGASEIIVDGVTGYVVNPFDVIGMANKIIDLLQNLTKAEKFGRAGYERVKTDFNLADKVREHLAWYNRLLNHET